MIFYEVIAGSRSYGLELPESDVDRCRVADQWQMSMEGRENIIQVPREEFLDRIFCRRNNAYFFQWLFPARVYTETAVSQYLMQRREAITRAQRGAVYRILTDHAQRVEYFSDVLYDGYPKRAAYAILFYAIAANYAEGVPFAQAHCPEKELRDFLLGIRRGETPLEEAMARMAIEKDRALKAEAFYDAAPDEQVLATAEADLRQLMGMSG